MKKLNNKGFAISTVIYGLSIMGILLVAMIMAEMATIRSNTRQMSKSIEEELNSLTRTATTFTPTGDSTTPTSQEYIVPEGQAGWYKIELWGTQGGANGGLGAYTSGVIFLDEGDVVYFYVGKHSATSGPGAETDVRVVSGSYTDQISYQSRIMIAAGGGPHADAFGGTLYGGQTSMKSYGGYIKTIGNNKEYTLYAPNEEGNPTNGTLVGYPKNYTRSSVNVPTIDGNKVIQSPHNGVGGDGYAPGNTTSVGGSSFIAGYAGCKAIVKGDLKNDPGYTYYEQIFDEGGEGELGHYTWLEEADPRIYYFLDGMMLPGVNTGDGKAKIEKVASKTAEKDELTKTNTVLKKVTAIRDCVDDVSNVSDWVIIPVVKGKVKAAESSSGKNGRCYTYNIGQTDLDEIAIWHKNLTGKDIRNHTVEVYSKTNNKWNYVKNKTNGAISETETETGTRISAYQYNKTGEIPQKGNYYILPVLSENKVVTASDTTEEDTNTISIQYLTGSATQKWSIELITNHKIASSYSYNVYKITELARYKSLNIKSDENKLDNTLNTTGFNNYAPNPPQIWKITPAGDGTYYISTVVSPYAVSIDSGNIMPQTNSKNGTDHINELLIGKNNNVTQRFRLIPIDYSSS